MYDSVRADKYLDHLKKAREELKKAQWSDQYKVEIQMLAPYRKAIIPQELIKQVSITPKGLSVQEIEAGSRKVLTYDEASSEQINITLYNNNQLTVDTNSLLDAILRGDPIDKIKSEVSRYTRLSGKWGSIDITDRVNGFIDDTIGKWYHEAENTLQSYADKYLSLGKSFLGDYGVSLNIPFVNQEHATEINLYNYFYKINGYDIVPKDGTYLLPDEWKFRVAIFALSSSWEEVKIIEDEYTLTDPNEIEFGSDSGSMQEIQLTFKRLI